MCYGRLESANNYKEQANEEQANERFALSVQDGYTQEVWLLFAETSQEAQTWVDVIEAVMKRDRRMVL